MPSKPFRLILDTCKFSSKIDHDEEFKEDRFGFTKNCFSQLREFTFKEIAYFTNNFNRKNELGEGSYGKVYFGLLENNSFIAIKRFKLEKRLAGQPLFLNEVEMISRASHKNLLRLIGYCMEKGERMLVFPYMANGSVASYFRGKKHSGRMLPWDIRKRIALGTARGLSYMHVDCKPRLIHRDVKAENVLLNDEMEPLLSDFGFTKLIDPLHTHATTSVKGTVCHIAPEYLSSGQTSEKTDVYGFGIFLVEIVSGKLAIEIASSTDTEDLSIEEWVMKRMDEGRLDAVIDPELSEEGVNMHEMEWVLRIALLCLQFDSTERPTMPECVTMLEGDGLMEKWERWRTLNISPHHLAVGIPVSSRTMLHGRKIAMDSEITHDTFSMQIVR